MENSNGHLFLSYGPRPPPYDPPSPPAMEEQRKKKKKKSNFEALSDETEEEVADRRKFYCFFCLRGGEGLGRGLKARL